MTSRSLIFLLLLAGVPGGQANAMTLDQAVAQVRQQHGGRVVSAETVNNQHLIRVLTAKGQVRLIRLPAGDGAGRAREQR